MKVAAWPYRQAIYGCVRPLSSDAKAVAASRPSRPCGVCVAQLANRPQTLGLRHSNVKVLLKSVSVSASPAAQNQGAAAQDYQAEEQTPADDGGYQGLLASPPDLYPFHASPVAQPAPGLPAWVWIMVGIVLANVFGKLVNFVRRPREALTEMMFKQMAKSMNATQGMGGQQNPFFTPGSGFPGMAGAGSPPVDTYATPVAPDGPAPPFSTPRTGTATSEQAPAQPQQATTIPVEAQPAASPAAFDPAGLGSTASKGTTAAGAATAPWMTSEQGPVSQGTMAGGGFFSDVTRPSDKSATASDDDVEWLFTLLKDPQMRESLYPFLPEQMRDPQMLETVFANPVVREQLKTMFTPDMMAKMREFQGSVNDPQLKQQLEGMNISPDVLMQKLMQEPELMALLQKPNVMEAVMDMNKSPENMTKYMNDPEVMKVMMKMSELTMQAQGQAPAPPQGQGFQQTPPFMSQVPPQPPPVEVVPPPLQPTQQMTAEQPAQQAPASTTEETAVPEDQDSDSTTVPPSNSGGTNAVEATSSPQQAQAGTSSG